MSVDELVCLRCTHRWLPRTYNATVRCPNPSCRSPYWNTPRKPLKIVPEKPPYSQRCDRCKKEYPYGELNRAQLCQECTRFVLQSLQPLEKSSPDQGAGSGNDLEPPPDLSVGQRVRLTHPSPVTRLTVDTGTVIEKCSAPLDGYWIVRLDGPWSYVDALGSHTLTDIRVSAYNLEPADASPAADGESPPC